MRSKELIDELCEAGMNPGKTIYKTMRETGKDLVGCFPYHTPDEIVYAAGMIPVALWGGNTKFQKADKYLQGFCCGLLRANMEFALNGTYSMLKAVIIPTFCDSMKCVLENMKLAMPKDVPVIGITYPQHRKINAGRAYAITEFERVRKAMEAVSGKIISMKMIDEAFEIYEEYRSAMREFCKIAPDYPLTITAKKRQMIIKAGQFMDKKAYTEKIKGIIEGLKEQKPEDFQGIKVVVTGISAESPEILDIFEENNIAIAADECSLGSRIWRTPARQGLEDAYSKMAYRIADQKGDTFLYEPEKLRGQIMIDEVKNKKADAIVLFMMKFCDPEEYDYPVYKKEIEKAGIPALYLEIDQQLTSYEQMRTRIQSFREMLV